MQSLPKLTSHMAQKPFIVAIPVAKTTVVQAVGPSENLLVVKLDVANPSDAQPACKAAVDRFGRIDVLVNNAGNFYAGFFEIRPGVLD